MKEATYFRQCILDRGETQQVVWIPQCFAVAGKYLRIKGENGWKVRCVGLEMDWDTLSVASREHRYHREVTDV